MGSIYSPANIHIPNDNVFKQRGVVLIEREFRPSNLLELCPLWSLHGVFSHGGVSYRDVSCHDVFYHDVIAARHDAFVSHSMDIPCE